MLLLPSRTGQSIFPIMRECVCRRKVKKKAHALFLSLHNSQAARLLITTLPILTQSPTTSLIHSFIRSIIIIIILFNSFFPFLLTFLFSELFTPRPSPMMSNHSMLHPHQRTIRRSPHRRQRFIQRRR